MEGTFTDGELLREVARAPAVSARQKPLSAGTRLGHFRVEALLGMGGMGLVYRAVDERLNRKVALKVLPTSRAHQRVATERLLSEARHVAAIRHPHVAVVHEVGEQEGVTFLAMELLPGTSLRQRLDQGSVHLAQPQTWLLQVADALAAAHRQGIVHRDLKPENVIICDSGEAKLIDFGIASTGGGRVRLEGTLGYCAPEAYLGQCSPRTDVYAFGVLVGELLRRVGKWRNRRFFAGIAKRCTQPDPENRYADGGALWEALQRGVKRRARATGAGVACAIGAMLASVAVFVLPSAPDAALAYTEHRLTSEPAENMIADAQLSPDGSTVAYADTHGVKLRRRFPLETRTVPLRAGVTVRSLDWVSPTSLLLLTAHPEQTGVEAWHVGVDGVVRSAWPVDARLVRVSGDGQRALYVADQRVFWRELDSDVDHEVARATPGAMLLEAAWSPNAEAITYLSLESSQAGVLRVVRADGGRSTEVRRSAGLVLESGVVGLTWGTDGQLYFSEASGPANARRADVIAQPIDATTFEVRGPGHSLQGWTGSSPGTLSVDAHGRVALIRVDSQLDVYVARLEAGGRRLGELERLTASDRDQRLSGWTHDSAAVLFTSDEDDRLKAFRVDVSGGAPIPLSQGVAEQESWPLENQEGQYLVTWRTPRARAAPMQLWATERATLKARMLLATPRTPEEHELNFPGRTWASVGCASRAPTCIYSQPVSDGQSFHRLDITDGSLSPRLARRPRDGSHPRGWALSGDGRQLAWVENDTVRFHALDDRPPKSPLRVPGHLLQFVEFLPDGGDVLVTGYAEQKGRWELMRISPGAEPVVLTESAASWIAQPLVSPDGTRLALAIKPHDTDIWVLEPADVSSARFRFVRHQSRFYFSSSPARDSTAARNSVPGERAIEGRTRVSPSSRLVWRLPNLLGASDLPGVGVGGEHALTRAARELVADRGFNAHGLSYSVRQIELRARLSLTADCSCVGGAVNGCTQRLALFDLQARRTPATREERRRDDELHQFLILQLSFLLECGPLRTSHASVFSSGRAGVDLAI